MKKFSRNSLILALLFYSATPAYGWSMPSFFNGLKEKTYVIGALTVASMAILGATVWRLFKKCRHSIDPKKGLPVESAYAESRPGASEQLAARQEVVDRLRANPNSSHDKPIEEKNENSDVVGGTNSLCALRWHATFLKRLNQEEREKYLKDFAEEFGSGLHDTLLERVRDEEREDAKVRLRDNTNNPSPETKVAQQERKEDSVAVDKGKARRVKKAATVLKNCSNDQQRQFYLKRLTEEFGNEFRADVLLLEAGLD